MKRAEYDRPHLPQKDFTQCRISIPRQKLRGCWGQVDQDLPLCERRGESPPLRKWCNGSRGSFVIQKELIDCKRNKLTSIDLKQHYNVKTRKAVTPTYHHTEFGSNPAWL